MWILKGFCRIVVSFDVQNGFFFLFFSIEHHRVEESNLVLRYLGHEFDIVSNIFTHNKAKSIDWNIQS